VPARIGVLTNRRAGHATQGRKGSALVLPRDPDVVHVVTDSTEDLPAALAELAAAEIEVLAVDGGDGTLHRVLTEILNRPLFDRLPPIAPLRGGRTNMAALDLGARRSPAKSVADLISALRQGQLSERHVRRPVLRVSRGGAGEPLYGFFIGTGVVRRTMRFIHRVFPPGRARGALGGGLTATSIVLQAAWGGRSRGVLIPDKHQIALDGDPVEPTEFLLVLATSLNRLMLHLRPFWGREAAPVRFTGIAWNATALGRNALPVASGKGTALGWEQGYLSRNVRTAQLRFDCGFTLDGELFDPEPEGSLRIDAVEHVPFLRA